MNKDIYINLILRLQKKYCLKESNARVLFLIDETMLSEQLANILNIIEDKSPNLSSSDGIGDFGVYTNSKNNVEVKNKKQLLIAALDKLDKGELINFSLSLIHINSSQPTINKSQFRKSCGSISKFKSVNT